MISWLLSHQILTSSIIQNSLHLLQTLTQLLHLTTIHPQLRLRIRPLRSQQRLNCICSRKTLLNRFEIINFRDAETSERTVIELVVRLWRSYHIRSHMVFSKRRFLTKLLHLFHLFLYFLLKKLFLIEIVDLIGNIFDQFLPIILDDSKLLIKIMNSLSKLLNNWLELFHNIFDRTIASCWFFRSKGGHFPQH